MQTINPVLQGLMQGVSVGNMIRQSALQQEAAEREKLRFEHERQVNDLQTRMMLAKNTRPITGGMVQDELLADMPEFDPANPGNAKTAKKRTTLVRPADKSRIARYKGLDGQTVEGEILLPEEQASREFANELDRLRAVSDIQNSAALARLQGELSLKAPMVANEQSFRRQLALDQRDFETEQSKARLTAAEKRDKENRSHQISMLNLREAAATRRNNADNAAANQRLSWSERVAKVREEKAAKAEADAAEKEVRKEQKKLKTEHDTLDRQTAGLWGAYQRIADAWDKSKAVMTIGEGGRVVPVKSKGGKEVTGDSQENQAQVEAIRRQIKAQLEPLERRKQEIMGTLRSAGKAPAGDLYSRYGL